MRSQERNGKKKERSCRKVQIKDQQKSDINVKFCNELVVEDDETHETLID